MKNTPPYQIIIFQSTRTSLFNELHGDTNLIKIFTPSEWTKLLDKLKQSSLITIIPVRSGSEWLEALISQSLLLLDSSTNYHGIITEISKLLDEIKTCFNYLS